MPVNYGEGPEAAAGCSPSSNLSVASTWDDLLTHIRAIIYSLQSNRETEERYGRNLTQQLNNALLSDEERGDIAIHLQLSQGREVGLRHRIGEYRTLLATIQDLSRDISQMQHHHGLYAFDRQLAADREWLRRLGDATNAEDIREILRDRPQLFPPW